MEAKTDHKIDDLLILTGQQHDVDDNMALH